MTITITENHSKAGIEIRFSEKPSRDTLDMLKGLGWRWNRKAQCWYTRRTPESVAIATRIKLESPAGVSVLWTESGVPPASQEDYPCSDTGYEDQCAERVGR